VKIYRVKTTSAYPALETAKYHESSWFPPLRMFFLTACECSSNGLWVAGRDGDFSRRARGFKFEK